ncbi:hypothetical protein [Nocardia salmonicida]|uniref:hypothetical protein n=1 Tax=Nocardia salmonicida TaxID=53431 RepID=UPI003449C4B3
MPERAIRALGRWVEAPDSVGGLVLERVAQPVVPGRFRTDAAAIVVTTPPLSLPTALTAGCCLPRSAAAR